MARETARPSFRSRGSRVGSMRGIGPRRASTSACRALDQGEKRKQTMPGGPLGLHPRAQSICGRGSGDVAMDPARLSHELAEEQCGSDRSAVTVTRLLQVRYVALDLLAEILEQRQSPHLLSRLFQRCAEFARGLFVACVPSRARGAESNHTRTGEGRVVDEEARG